MPVVQPSSGHERAAQPAADRRSARAVTPRSILLGLVLVPLLCWWSLKHELIHGGSEFVEASLIVVVVFALFGLVLVNHSLRRWAPRLAFSQGELITVYIMLTVSVGIAGLGQMQFLPQTLGAVFYFATPENGWADLQPLVPRWLVPDPAVLPAFYKGNSTFFTPAHLRGWAVPILVWTGFILALLGAMLCLSVMIRRPWVEHERLTFPLVYLPLELTREETSRSLLRSHSFWIAFALACTFRSITGLHWIMPSFPDLAPFANAGQLFYVNDILVNPPWNAIGYTPMSFHPMIIGITYFLPLDVAFSAWLFFLVVKAEQVLAAALGWEPAGGGTMAEPPYTGEQGAGAFLAIALLALWGARRHLAAVWRKALTGDSRVEDRDEPLSYRAAVFGFLAALAMLVLFMSAARLGAHLAAAFFLLYLVYVLAVTRLRAEAGPMLNFAPHINPHRLMVDVAGVRYWSAQDLASISTVQWFDLDYRTVAMPQQLEAFKLAESARIPPRRLSLWLFAATALAVIASWVAILAIYYHYGATTPRGDNGWRIDQGMYPFELLSEWLEDPADTDWLRVRWIGVGSLVTAALVYLRGRVLWWPLHPSGFAMAHAGLTLAWVWSPILIGWAVKTIILRYGGMKLYRAWVPFFLGLLLGDIVIGVIWSIIGAVLDVNVYMFFPG
jgi:Ca2+/Na+ antiporter